MLKGNSRRARAIRKAGKVAAARTMVLAMQKRHLGVNPIVINGERRWVAQCVDSDQVAFGPNPMEAVLNYVARFQAENRHGLHKGEVRKPRGRPKKTNGGS